MKLILSAVALAAGIASGNAKPIDAVVRNPIASFTTSYPAMEAFYHVVGDKSYIGYFQSKASVCSVWVLTKPADETPGETATQHQVEFDLPAAQTMNFIVNSRGSTLSLRCAADAKSLVVSQTWAPVAKASAAAMPAGQDR